MRVTSRKSLPLITLLLYPHLGFSQIDRYAWHCHVDSFQFQGEYDDCAKAIDGDVTTYWHTQWTPANDSLPHNITIDMARQYNTVKMTYLPIQTQNDNNGKIGQWQILIGNDTTSGRLFNGTWPDDETLKTVEFGDPIRAQFLVLTAFTEAGWAECCTGAAEINIFEAEEDGSSGPQSSQPSISPSTGQSSPQPTQQASKDSNGDNGGGGGGGGLNTIQTVFTVIGAVAAVITVILGLKKCGCM
ncbi:MAG: hypothetical protein L6R41_000997 [Letrouitia leprolyta]|nr:MAG: hypothetical protein L6R41_000997 [Letrouitia leprolyta]